jgi:hypothetical protein
MTLLHVSTSRSDQAAGLPTAPQGNVTQAGHNQSGNRTIRWNATAAVNPGEAEQP